MTTPVIHGLSAVTAHVKDIAKARTFYTKTLGLRELNFDAGSKASYFEIPGSTVALAIHQFDVGCKDMGGRPPGTVSGIVFNVPNVPRAVEDLKKRGVSITEPSLMNGASAAFADPDGNEYMISGK